MDHLQLIGIQIFLIYDFCNVYIFKRFRGLCFIIDLLLEAVNEKTIVQLNAKVLFLLHLSITYGDFAIKSEFKFPHFVKS